MLAGTRFDLFFPLLYALAYGIVGLAMHLTGDAFGDIDIDTDFYGDLLLAARALARGEFAVSNYPYKGPLYSFALVAVHAFAGDWYRSAVLVALASAGASLFLVYRLMLALFGRHVAVAAMIGTSLVADFFVHAHHATTDLLFLALAMGSVLLFCTGRTMRTACLAAGALGGLAALTRYNGFFLPVGALLGVAVAGPGAMSRRARLGRAIAYGGIFLLACLPWLAANLRATGRLLPTQNVQNVATGLFSGPRWAGAPVDAPEDLGALAAQDPVHLAVQFTRNLAGHVVLDLTKLLGFPMALLAVVGLLGLALGWLRTRPGRGSRPAGPAGRSAAAPRIAWQPTLAQRTYLGFALVYFVSLGVVFYAPRFSFFLVPAYLAPGLAIALGDARRWPRRWRAVLLIPFGVAVLAIQVARIHAVESRLAARRPVYLLAGARALRAHAGTGGDVLLMARKGHLAYLAGMRYQPYPKRAARSLDRLLDFAREHRVRYIAYGIPERELCPDLGFLADADSIPGLRRIHDTSELRVFELESGAAASTVPAATQRELLVTNLRSAETRRSADRIVRALGDLAQFDAAHGAVEEAEMSLRRAIAISDTAKAAREIMQRNASVGRHRLAELLLATGRAEEAQPLLDLNLAYFERHGSAQDVARALLWRSRCWEALGQSAEASRDLARARALAPDLLAPTTR